MKNLIALDLELEQPNRFPEITDSQVYRQTIIQVGWTVFHPENFRVHKVTYEHVFYPHPLSGFIKNLTGISDKDVWMGTPLVRIYDMVVEDLKEFDTSRIICQWGGGDIEEIKDNIPDKKVWEFGRSGMNVKHLFITYAMANGIKHRGGLSKCMGRLGLTWEGRGKHKADVDSLNTAKMYSELFNRIKKKK